MSQMYQRYADMVFWAHFGWVMLTITSLPFLILISWYRFVALAIIVIDLFAWIIHKKCPFTEWENKFRSMYNPSAVYKKTCIAHYLDAFFSIRVSDTFVHIISYTYAIALLILIFIP
jgi:hypothetical protein